MMKMPLEMRMFLQDQLKQNKGSEYVQYLANKYNTTPEDVLSFIYQESDDEGPRSQFPLQRAPPSLRTAVAQTAQKPPPHKSLRQNEAIEQSPKGGKKQTSEQIQKFPLRSANERNINQDEELNLQFASHQEQYNKLYPKHSQEDEIEVLSVDLQLSELSKDYIQEQLYSGVSKKTHRIRPVSHKQFRASPDACVDRPPGLNRADRTSISILEIYSNVQDQKTQLLNLKEMTKQIKKQLKQHMKQCGK